MSAVDRRQALGKAGLMTEIARASQRHRNLLRVQNDLFATNPVGEAVALGAGFPTFSTRSCRAVLLGMACVALGIAFHIPPSAAQATRSQTPSREELRGFLDRPSLDRHTLRLERDGVRLDVPRNYLIEWYPTVMTTTAPSFMAMANFPGFGGATRETIRCFDVLGVIDERRCDVVLFSLAHTARPLTEPGRFPGLPLDERTQPEPAEFGLVRDPLLRDRYAWIGRNSHETLTVSCPQMLRRCEMALTQLGFDWRVQFPKRLLPEWRAIADGLRALLTTFEPTANSEGRTR